MTPDVLAGVAVAGGSALGAVARFQTDAAVNRRFSGALPLGTLLINILGTFVLAIVVTRTSHSPWGLFLGTGCCGGFTTFSTLSVEVATLLRQRAGAVVAGYLALTLVGGVLAFLLGRALAG